MSVLKDVLSEKWFWIIVVALIFIFIGSIAIVLVLVYLPPPWNAIATIIIIVLWGVVSGYKDWVKSKGERAR